MNIKTLSLVFGAALTVAAGGLAATACSSSSNPSNPGGNDASTNHDTGSSSGGNNDSGGGGDDGNTGPMNDAGTPGVDCGKVASLHVDEAGTIYCGYAGDSGALTCPTGQQCCLGGEISTGNFKPQECGTFGSACLNNGPGDSGPALAIPIECNQMSDCNANGKQGDVCCLVGAGEKTPMGCEMSGTIKFSGGSAIQCETPTSGACAVGENQICSQDLDCPTGQKCIPGHWKIFNVGFCFAGDSGL